VVISLQLLIAPESDEMTTQSRRVRVDWYTNSPAPYRFRIWAHLSERFEFRLRLLENSRRFSRDTGNRGTDWILNHIQHPYPVDEIRTLRYYIGEIDCYLALGRLFPSARPDVIIIAGWESPAHWQLLTLARLRRISTIGFYESTLLTQSQSSGPVARAREYFFQHLDAIVTPGIAATRALKQMGISGEKIHQGFNPVDVELFHAAGAHHQRDARKGHRYVFAGQLRSRKNPLAVLEAFAEIAETDDELWLVGTGELAQTLAARTAQLGMTSQVSMKGLVAYDELPCLLADCDTLVLPSHVEVWGLVVNEALATGLTVIVNERCGVAEDVKFMQGVILYRDNAELVDAMRRVKGMPRIATPEILKYSQERFGDVFASAITSVVSMRSSEGK
jgi:glycosyltransferase involved in cell wall biosynthesis